MDSFTDEVSDGRGGTATAVATVTVGTRGADWHRDGWTADVDDWHRRTFDVGDLDTTIVTGNTLRLRMMHGHNDLWVAVSGDRPSNLTVTPG